MSCRTVEANSLNLNDSKENDLLAESEKHGRHMDKINNFCEAGSTNENVLALYRSEIKPMMTKALPPNAND